MVGARRNVALPARFVCDVDVVIIVLQNRKKKKIMNSSLAHYLNEGKQRVNKVFFKRE